MGKLLSLVLIGMLFLANAKLASAQSTFAEKPPGVEPIVTAERLFSIPFYLNPRQRRPDELYLYVSGNQGKEWSLYQRRAPHQEKFDFQAGDEGEYWFVIRTPVSRAAPGVYDRPEKIVVVDESKPELNVNVQLGATGEVKAEWEATDPYLDTSTFKLSYQGPNDDEWRPVTVRLPVTQGDDTFAGKVSWAVTGNEGEVLVRVEVMDRAGNSSLFQDSVVLNSVAVRSTHPAGNPNPSELYTTTSDGHTATPDGYEARSNPGPAAVPSEPQLPMDVDDRRAGVESSIRRPDAVSSFTSHNDGWSTTNVSEPGSDPFGQSFGIVDPIMDPLDAVSRAHAGPVQSKHPQPVANQIIPNQPPADIESSSDTDSSNPTEGRSVPSRVQVTKSRRFNLDYEVSDTGESGLARVELWISRDQGRSWAAYDVDEDRQSPFEVQLDSEGTFGFRLLIHNGLGASSRPPQPGDEADLWVSVDWSPPLGEITSARFGEGPKKKQLIVTWKITDQNLGESPIQLSYSDRPNGPWMPLDRPVENVGRSEWQMNFRLPPEIYLKMDVEDKAGNVTQLLYPRPIRTVSLPPSGRIRAVRPIEGL